MDTGDGEIWKDVPHVAGYQVSSIGRVRSIDRVIETTQGQRRLQGRILRATMKASGHMLVGLGRAHKRTVHSLVLEAFVGPCPQGHEGLHRNGVPSDNRLENLRYGTRSENIDDRVFHGQTKLSVEDVLEIRRSYAANEMSGLKLAAKFGVGKSLIYHVIKGESYGCVR